MHSRGINLKFLPLLYTEVTNKLVKKYVHSFMVAKVAKDDILANVAGTRHDRGKGTSAEKQLTQLIEKSIKLLI